MSEDQENEIIEYNKRRGSGELTGIICARCGNQTDVHNKDLLPFIIEGTLGRLIRIYWECPHCKSKYDIGLARIN